MDALQSAIDWQSDDFFPSVGAAILVRTHTQHVDFLSGSGMRAVVMAGQDSFFANNEAAVYEFHGLSADGQYYVVVTIPVDAPFLLSTYDPEENTNEAAIPVPELPNDIEQLYAVIREYNQEAERQLEQLDASRFTPNLQLLDALVNSLEITSQ